MLRFTSVSSIVDLQLDIPPGIAVLLPCPSAQVYPLRNELLNSIASSNTECISHIMDQRKWLRTWCKIKRSLYSAFKSQIFSANFLNIQNVASHFYCWSIDL